MNISPRPLRILVLTTSFPLVQGARSGVFVKQLVENLPADLQVSVLTPDGTTRAASQSDKFVLIRFRYAPRKWQQLAHGPGGILASLSQKKLSCLLLPLFLFSSLVSCFRYTLKVDVVHANWSINGVIAGLAGFLAGKPVLTTLRGSDVNLIRSSWLMRQLVHLCLCLSKRVVVVSTSLRESIEKEFPDHCHKIQVIFNGIDDRFYVRKKYPVVTPAKTVRFLYVGNLVKGKGVNLILEAAASLTNQDWALDIVGDGVERHNLITFCKQNSIDTKVTFHGAVAPEKVPCFLQKADVFVLASLSEGRPNVVLEAMATGLPVIASGIPAIQELITHGDQGLLFPCGNIEKLTEAMGRMISQVDERRMMGKAAREYILAQKLSWPEAGRQYAAVYHEMHKNRMGAQ